MKVISMKEAISEYVQDGATVAIEGFTAFICFSAAHEIIRQNRKELTLCRMTPDLIYDQMVAAGCARKMIFSYLGIPGGGPQLLVSDMGIFQRSHYSERFYLI